MGYETKFTENGGSKVRLNLIHGRWIQIHGIPLEDRDPYGLAIHRDRIEVSHVDRWGEEDPDCGPCGDGAGIVRLIHTELRADKSEAAYLAAMARARAWIAAEKLRVANPGGG